MTAITHRPEPVGPMGASARSRSPVMTDAEKEVVTAFKTFKNKLDTFPQGSNKEYVVERTVKKFIDSIGFLFDQGDATKHAAVIALRHFHRILTPEPTSQFSCADLSKKSLDKLQTGLATFLIEPQLREEFAPIHPTSSSGSLVSTEEGNSSPETTGSSNDAASALTTETARISPDAEIPSPQNQIRDIFQAFLRQINQANNPGVIPEEANRVKNEAVTTFLESINGIRSSNGSRGRANPEVRNVMKLFNNTLHSLPKPSGVEMTKISQFTPLQLQKALISVIGDIKKERAASTTRVAHETLPPIEEEEEEGYQPDFHPEEDLTTPPPSASPPAMPALQSVRTLPSQRSLPVTRTVKLPTAPRK